MEGVLALGHLPMYVIEQVHARQVGFASRRVTRTRRRTREAKHIYNKVQEAGR